MIKIGAIGTSFIMDTILENMSQAEGICCKALYSRSLEKASAIAEKYNISNIYDRYEDMLSSDEINWVYVCSPNSLHYQHSKAALLAGEHVLCEKPFTVTSAELEELISLAKERNLFLFEAILPLFHPHHNMIREHLKDIAPMKMGTGIFCQYSSRYEALKKGEVANVFNPQYAGGALMDLNVYNIYFFVSLFGLPDNITYTASLYENGIDTNGVVKFQYPGMICECIAAKDAYCENSVQIAGENGYIRVTPAASNLTEVTIVSKGKENIQMKADKNPWYYEMIGLVQLVKDNDVAECYRRLEIALNVVKVLEKARESLVHRIINN